MLRYRAGQLTGKHDKKAVREWIEDNAAAEETDHQKPKPSPDPDFCFPIELS